MSDPKRHHLVPRMLLRHFADGDGNLLAVDRRLPHRGIFGEHYTKLLVETHFYSYRNDDGSRDPRPERMLGDVESAAAPIVESIIEAARKGVLPALTQEQRASLDAFAYRQWKRAPEVLARLSLDQFQETVERSLQEVERQFGRLPDAMRQHFVSEEYQARAFHNAKLDAMIHEGPVVMEALKGCGLYIAVIPHSRKSFIIGSCPVAKLTMPGDGELGGPTTELWLPIATDIALVWHGPPTYRIIPYDDTRGIRNTNEVIAAHSTLIAGRSEALLSSLSAACWPR